MPFTLRHNSWLVKYKLYHIPFWVLYHYTWWSVNIGTPVLAQSFLASPYGVKTLFYIIFQAAGAYFNLYFLMPRLLEKGRYLSYLLSLLVTMIVVAMLVASGYFFSSYIAGKPIEALYGVDKNSFWRFFQLNTLPSTVASTTLAMCVKLSKKWLESKRREQQLEKEKLETELIFLRSQFNPHFLFNTINSIFVLIHRNPGKASDSLAKFSALLRYQLYECNEQYIPLSQELGYLQNFIDLEKLRQEKELRLATDIRSSSRHVLQIAPFILIPFVENAFKHAGADSSGQCSIDIDLKIEEDELELRVVNTKSSMEIKTDVLAGYGGLGLSNVRRRLGLIYPGAFDLRMENETESYRVTLRLQLSVIEVPETKKMYV